MSPREPWKDADEDADADAVVSLPFTAPHPAFAIVGKPVIDAPADQIVPVLLLAARRHRIEESTSYWCVLPDFDGQIEQLDGEQVFYTEEAARRSLERRRAQREAASRA